VDSTNYASHYEVFFSFLLLSYKFKYPPQHPVLRHPQSIFV